PEPRLELPRGRLHRRARRARLEWMVPGVIFVLMGGVPLVIGSRGLRGSAPIAARFGMPYVARASGPGPSLGWDVSHRAVPGGRAARIVVEQPERGDRGGGAGDSAVDVVARLERLAEMRRRWDLTSEEFER